MHMLCMRIIIPVFAFTKVCFMEITTYILGYFVIYWKMPVLSIDILLKS